MDIASLAADYSAGLILTQSLVDSYARDGVDVLTDGRRVGTDDEMAAIYAHSRTLPSTPANNVWD